MSEEDRARPVSGEIMAGDPTQAPAPRKAADFSDAEYETVATEREAAPARFSEAKPVSGMDFLKGGAAAIGGGSKRGGPLFWAFGLALVALAFWVSGGHALVRPHVAAYAPADTLQPLRIGEVRSRVETHNDRAVLFVDGRAENHGARPLALPPIEIAVTANDGGTTRYFLGTSAPELQPGGRYSFSSRLEAPTNGVKSVSVTFQEGNR